MQWKDGYAKYWFDLDFSSVHWLTILVTDNNKLLTILFLKTFLLHSIFVTPAYNFCTIRYTDYPHQVRVGHSLKVQFCRHFHLDLLFYCSLDTILVVDLTCPTVATWLPSQSLNHLTTNRCPERSVHVPSGTVGDKYLSPVERKWQFLTGLGCQLDTRLYVSSL